MITVTAINVRSDVTVAGSTDCSIDSAFLCLWPTCACTKKIKILYQLSSFRPHRSPRRPRRLKTRKISREVRIVTIELALGLPRIRLDLKPEFLRIVLFN
ncbi:Protein of unknown function [Cotesia congregata]|uniref:Uncharacterized protein n=1 Tax=Cotesia congregata TaxID=51543 RepID=A0A8J2HA80_COTCN|nr:Protein of unknown function [Cotesia congregata]